MNARQFPSGRHAPSRPAGQVVWIVVALLASGCGRIGFATDSSSEASDAPASTGTSTVGGFVPQGGVEVGGTINRLLVAGTSLFAATTRAGAELVVYDISSPAAPVEIGTAATAGTPFGLDVSGSRLYVATETGGDDLEIFDITNPSAPTKLGGIATAGTAYAVRVAADRAYVTTAFGGDDFETFDVANPSAPVKLGGLPLVAAYAVRGVDIAGTTAFAAGQRFNPIDVTDPAAPVVRGDQGFYWYAEDLVVTGERAVALESNNDNGPQLRTFDVTDLQNPMAVGTASTWHHYARDLEVVGRYGFTVCAPGTNAGSQLEVFDISVAGDPPLVTSVSVPTDGNAVEVAGTYAYVGTPLRSGAELLVFEITP